ncbi:sterol desaturase family protein [Candidatus Magnetaquicoccus inordinatus]|uniref:sterol desaturase family protein n=1 Tax=Candidatus Magnetaquicoccus inordinatus TaxID=2496818 RepID=UPI00102CA9FA|nr:sterol desaturase family protein [Candidatus Magnetaquicoccus inordinatus]
MESEAVLRLGIFMGVLAVMVAWEFVLPKRGRTLPRLTRWLPNLALVAIDTLLVRILFPVTAVALATLGQKQGWGMLNQLDWPVWSKVLLAVILLDFIIYLQHLLFHALPILWRLHMVHHADLDVDVTTGLRFHPLEILLSMAIKLAAVHTIGASPLAVLLFEVLLNGMALFNHSNIRLPQGVDRILRCCFVTPDMHRSHHSLLAPETNTNFGFNLSWWDRVLGTYWPAPTAGHAAMQTGLEHLREPEKCQPLTALLLLPFRAKLGEYTINRRW